MLHYKYRYKEYCIIVDFKHKSYTKPILNYGILKEKQIQAHHL